MDRSTLILAATTAALTRAATAKSTARREAFPAQFCTLFPHADLPPDCGNDRGKPRGGHRHPRRRATETTGISHSQDGFAGRQVYEMRTTRPCGLLSAFIK